MMKKIGNIYEVKRRLGSGAFGDIYLVIDKVEGEELCLKVIGSRIEGARQDIVNEFSILARLYHPNLIYVRDYGIDETEGPYFTMEYISGGDLNSLIPLRPAEFFKASIMLCSALQYLHDRGVVHGDLKPSNILKDSSGNYRVADFGLSFMEKNRREPASSGTIAFMSPEVLRKESVSPLSDIYSLAVLFYEMITGKPLYEGTSAEILSGKLSPQLPEFRVPEEYGGGDLQAVIVKMLSADPVERFGSTDDIGERLALIAGRMGYSSGLHSALPDKGEFVGRVDELKWLRDGALKSGVKGRLYFMGGDSGVGKSRLLDEFRINCQLEGKRLFKTACREGEFRPLAPVVKLLNRVLSELDPERRQFSSYGPDLGRLIPEEQPDAVSASREFIELEAASGRRRMFDNLLRFLNYMSREHGLILGIEDLQWSDLETIGFLEYCQSMLDGSQYLYIICTGTTTSDDSIPSFLTSEKDSCRILKTADHALWVEFLDGFFGAGKIPGSLTESLFEETGGNFLFAEEIIKELASSDLLSHRHGSWALSEGWQEDIRIPDGIVPLIGRRLTRLSSGERALAELAAVMGRSFYEDDILQMAVREASSEDLRGLQSKGIIQFTGRAREERMYFAHLQLRRAILDSMEYTKRREWHKRIAGYFSQRDDDDEFLGRHFSAAGDYERGFDYLMSSARHAERVFGFRQSVDLYKMALECAREMPESTRKRDGLYNACMGAGKTLDFMSPPEATGFLMEALKLAGDREDHVHTRAEAATAVGLNSLHLGRHDEALGMLERAVAAAGESGEARIHGEAHVALGFVHDKMGRLDLAEESYRRALDLFAGIDYPEGSCRVLNYLGIARKKTGDLRGAEDFYRRALEICADRGFKWSAMNLHGNLGNLYSVRRDYETAKRHYDSSLEISREISDRRIESVNLLNIGHLLNQMGELREAEKIFVEALDKQRALGDRSSEAITFNNLGLLYFRKGEFKNSLDNYEQGLRISSAINQPRSRLANIIGIVEVLDAVGAYDDALSRAREAGLLAEEINDIEQQAAILPLWAETCYSAGNSAEARLIARKFMHLPPDVGEPRQVIKALLLANSGRGKEGSEKEEIDERVGQLTAASPAAGCIATRYNASEFLRGGEVPANPEIWIARIDDAITKSKSSFLHAETARLMALKLRYLDLAGETLEAARLKEKLSKEAGRMTAGFDGKIADGLLRSLYMDDKIEGKVNMNMSGVGWEERLEVLFRVARTINTIRETDPLLNKIMDLAIETLNAERGFIMLYVDGEHPARGDNQLEPVVARNLDQKDILGEKTISKSSALEVARTGKPLLLSRGDDEVTARQSVVDFRISSLLCVPLAVKGRVLGIVYVDSRYGVVFSDDDLEFLSSFADLAAIAIENARLTERLEEKTVYLQKQVESTWEFGNIVGRSSPMMRVFRMAESVAASDVNVIISGESGTGKELLARAIHFASKRKNSRFQPVDCGAVTETLLESELFGYVRGAFTGAASDRAGLFEVAQGGTIFLDEITNTSGNFQAKLLRVLQENEIRRVGDNKSRKIDVRVIAATNKDLEAEVEAGAFREDLYYRLNVINIPVPPLRNRKEDIHLLANYFLEKISHKMNVPTKSFSPEAADILQLYSWPGNVRQLENICERAMILSKDEIIDIGQLPPELRVPASPGTEYSGSMSVPETKSELKAAKSEMDHLFVVELLRRARGNVMKAAGLSGMDRSQLHHMISKFGINPSDFK